MNTLKLYSVATYFEKHLFTCCVYSQNPYEAIKQARLIQTFQENTSYVKYEERWQKRKQLSIRF